MPTFQPDPAADARRWQWRRAALVWLALAFDAAFLLVWIVMAHYCG